MDLYFTQVPIWLSILFAITFFCIPPLLIANTVKKVCDEFGLANGSSIRKNILVFYWCYFIIVAFISLAGIFSINTLPPRIIIITVLPLFLFYQFYITKRIWFKTLFSYIKLEQLIYIHIFRLVGVFFFFLNYYEVLPRLFTNIGGIGDILSAALIFPVIYALKSNKIFAKPLVWIWNCIGTLDIVSVLITAIYITKVSLENDKAGVLEFGSFPFSWIPAFAPATIIFLHLLVFKKLVEKQKTQE